MVSPNCILFLVLFAVQESIQKSTPKSTTYKAAAAEFNPVVYENDPAKTLQENAAEYDKLILKAVRKDADIIVFPEFGLTSVDFLQRSELINWATLVPDPSQNFVPCDAADASQVLKNISCAAKQHGIYVVVNLIEKDECSGSECDLFYSTNVVFDQIGKIIARYRRFHQFENPGLFNTTKSPELSTFKTDFGVKFATAISFDIMYEQPLLTLIEKSGITDIVYTSAWRSVVPFLTAIQMQAGWACAEKVNLVSAGYNRVNEGYFGSGIYAECRVVASTLKASEILINQVPKISRRKAASITELGNNGKHDPLLTNDSHQSHVHDELRRKRNLQDLNVEYEQLSALDCESRVITKNGLTEKKLKHKSIECNFRVNVSDLVEPTTYYLIAYDGVRSFGNVTEIGTKICAIVQCANGTIDSCGHIQKSTGKLSSIVINVIADNKGKMLFMPNTLTTDLKPLISGWKFDRHEDGDNIHNSISLTSPAENLITFGVWGRNFINDTPSSATKILSQLLCLPLFVILVENVRNFF